MESIVAWAAENWFDSLQSFGIIGSLLLAAWTVADDHRSRVVENRLQITKYHRELWSQLSDNPKLGRVLDASADLEIKPLTVEEERFVTMAILHLNAHFYAASKGLLAKPEGLKSDIASFFSLPIPRKVWGETKHLRDAKFAHFVEAAISEEG